MSEYQVKSDVYATAAEQLSSLRLYAPVGHTAYYSCFLLFEHIYCLCDYEQDELDLRYYDNAGSHQKTINGVTCYIHDKSPKESQLIRTKIGDLKKLRLSADYDNKPFTPIQASNAISLMKSIRSLLEKYL